MIALLLALACHLNSVNDGPKGFLSKTSDAAHYNAWTVLLPANRGFKQLDAFQGKKHVARFKYEYPFKEDGSGRPVFRASHSTDKYPKNLVLQSIDNKRKCQQWNIKDPTKRVD